MPTPNSGIPYVPENTTDPAAGLNLSLNVIDALLTPQVAGLGTSAPPMSPSDGDLYIVGPAASGEWSGQDDNLARYVAEGDFWQFYSAGTQVKAVLYLGAWYTFFGSAGWVGAGVPSVNAAGVSYDNLASGLSANDVQAAIDEIAGGGGGATFPAVVNTALTSLPLPAADAGKYVRFTATGAKTLTVRLDATEPLPANGEWHFRNAAGGDLTVSPVSGVTVNPPAGGTLIVPTDGTVTLKRVALDTFDLIGQTVPV